MESELNTPLHTDIEEWEADVSPIKGTHSHSHTRAKRSSKIPPATNQEPKQSLSTSSMQRVAPHAVAALPLVSKSRTSTQQSSHAGQTSLPENLRNLPADVLRLLHYGDGRSVVDISELEDEVDSASEGQEAAGMEEFEENEEFRHAKQMAIRQIGYR